MDGGFFAHFDLNNEDSSPPANANMKKGISKLTAFAVAAICAVLSESAAQDCSGAGFKSEDAGQWTTAAFKVLFHS